MALQWQNRKQNQNSWNS